MEKRNGQSPGKEIEMEKEVADYLGCIYPLFEWQPLWERYKMEQRMKNEWSDALGNIKNPGKSFFLELTKKATDQVNRQRDENGITYARKAMIMCGLALNTNGLWEEKQLTPKLQELIRKYRVHFNGEPVHSSRD